MRRLVDALATSIWSTLATFLALSVVAVALGVAFRLSLSGSIALYFVVWWTVLFVILPIRIETQADLGTVAEGTDPGAPAFPALRERSIWTSLLSTLVFGLIAAFFPLAGL